MSAGTTVASSGVVLHRLVAAAMVVSLVGCSRTTPRAQLAVPIARVEPVVIAPPEPAPSVSAIALNEKQSVELTADGTMVDVTPTTRLAIGRSVLTLKSGSVKDTYQCDYIRIWNEPPVHSEGAYHAETLSLVDAWGKETVIVPPATKLRAGLLESEETLARVVAAVGRYLFVREEHRFFGCGADVPMWGVDRYVWDAVKGERVEFAAPTAALARAETNLAGRGFAETPRAEAIARFDPEGRLSIAWRFHKGAGYRETHGDSAGTVSTTVESDELPEELVAYRTPPPAIRNYLANGGEPIIGWTTVD